MLKTYLYIPEELDNKIIYIAKALQQSKAKTIRQVLEKGLYEVKHQGAASAHALLEMAEIGRKNNVQGPKDSSENMDDYLWGTYK